MNALVRLRAEAARSEIRDLPDGSLAGVPFVLKDLLAAIGGEPLESGSRYFVGWRPATDSEIVRRYRESPATSVSTLWNGLPRPFVI